MEAKTDHSMQIMVNEIRVYCGTDPRWSGTVAQAERLCENGFRSVLTTLHDMVVRQGANPGPPVNPWLR